MKRRTVLRAGGALLGVGVAAPLLLRSGEPGQLLPSQVRLPEAFRLPLAVPSRLSPVRADATTDYYEITQKVAPLSILSGLTTSAWTYNGTFPGPTIVSTAGRRTVVRHTNTLPEPVVVHLHGGHTPATSDGYPIDLLLPSSGYDMRSMHGDMATMMRDVKTGTRDYEYPMQQRAATLWYHDHHMGATGPNVWRGLAGFHLVEDDSALPLPRGERDIPLMLTDRSFAADGSFRYAAKMNGLLGDVMLVNGVPWPVMTVDPARYRLRLLNASNARRYRLELDPQPDGGDGIVQIGSDGGLLAAPIRHDSIDIAPAERFDVVIDFSRYRPGTRIRLLNRLGSGRMAEVMRFDVTGSGRTDDSAIPQQLSDVQPLSRSAAVATRNFVFRQAAGKQWTVNDMAYRPGRALAMPRLGTTEIWRFTTDLHHPVHLHLNHFQVLSRNTREPGPFDAGWKDTVDLRPAEVVEVAIRFTDYAGTFMLHCHNLEHEDMAMMADFVTA